MLFRSIADCFLFRPRKRLEKSKKRSHTNVSNASVTRTSRIFQAPLQTPLPCFHQWVSRGKKWSWHNRLQNGPRLLSHLKVGTHSPAFKGSRTRAHRAKQGLFRMGALLLPSERFTRFGNPAWPSIRTANFAAFEPWSRALSKNAESLGTAMRSCVSLFRGVAAPLGCVIFFAFVEIAVFTPCA